MKEILFSLSDKLYNRLNQIKSNLSLDEDSDIGWSDMLEEAVMSFYRIKITDINEKDDVNINIINNMNYFNDNHDYYVYAYFNMDKNIEKYICNVFFEYEPIYIGKGNGRRMYDLNNRDSNLKKKIIELKEKGLLKIEKILTEQIFINGFGKLNDGTGILYNKSKGNGINKKEITENNYKLNIEYNFINYIISTLNTEKTIQAAARKLNISERSLFRKIKKYLIIKDKEDKTWYIKKNQ